MTADIAHDLRSPLSVIAGYTEALNDGKLPGTPEVYGILYQETLHLNRLVEDLRTLSLADAGELVLQPVRIIPDELLNGLPAPTVSRRNARVLKSSWRCLQICKKSKSMQNAWRRFWAIC